MGRPSTFTADDIRTIAAMRRQGASWRAIGARVGRANTLCRRVWVECMGNPGGWARPRGSGQPKIRPSSRTPYARPLPAGSSISWGAIMEPIALAEAVLS